MPETQPRPLSRRLAVRSLGAVLLSASAARANASTQPNVVVIVSDDHGYADLSCYDHPGEIKTPNIDRIAKRGVRFTQGYASAYVCAPTRAALLTGRYSQRFGFYTASDSRAGMPLGERTMADVLKARGYTTGAFGKWHLGVTRPFHPLKRGFDEFYGFLGHGAHDYFDLKRKPEEHGSIWRNNEVIDDTGYLTDNLGREAQQFVQRNRERPFFLYLAFNAVHFPLQAPEEIIRKYDTGKRNRDIYLAMLEREDAAVGRVLDELERWKLDRNTVLFFLSDNGGARNNASSNGKLRDYKHSVYEGGIRVPFLMSWPERVAAGVISNEPVICMDVLPTVAAATEAALASGRIYDGRNLLPAVTGQSSSPLHPELFWDGDEGKTAVRSGRWKLVVNSAKKELYDLEKDPGEQNDLASRMPEVAARLGETFTRWRSEMAPRIARNR
jgi:arylsulfatase A-like enzyme